MLDKYKARDMAQFLDIFHKEMLDEHDEPIFLKKTDDSFFERIVGLLPMFVKDMNN